MSKKYLVIILFFLFFILFFTAFGQQGIIHICRLVKERNQIVAFNEKVKEENRNLRETIYSLKKDRGYIEGIARKKFGLVKEGEIIYRFKE